MKYFEFGQEHSELMVMLHGGGVSYLGMLPTAQKLAERYHVVLVAYDGFNPQRAGDGICFAHGRDHNHMQYQIRDPQGFAAMLDRIIEQNELPPLPFLRK